MKLPSSTLMCKTIILSFERLLFFLNFGHMKTDFSKKFIEKIYFSEFLFEIVRTFDVWSSQLRIYQSGI